MKCEIINSDTKQESSIIHLCCLMRLVYYRRLKLFVQNVSFYEVKRISYFLRNVWKIRR